MVKPLLLASRPKTLPAAAAPVLAASALAYADGAFRAVPAMLALGFALLIQIGTNYANDYFDFIKGADGPGRKGPKRAVASGMISPSDMRRVMFVTFGIAFLEGLCLIPFGGWPLIAVGVASVLFGLAYTGGPYPLAYNGLADIFVMVFFGIVAVTMTYYVQTGTVTWDSFILSLAPGALSVNLLTVNNYRDHDSDIAAGKRTLVARFGRRAGALEYSAMLVLAFAVPLLLWARGRDALVLIPLMSAPLGLMLLRILVKSRTRDEFGRTLGGTSMYLILYCVLAGLGLLAA